MGHRSLGLGEGEDGEDMATVASVGLCSPAMNDSYTTMSGYERATVAPAIRKRCYGSSEPRSILLSTVAAPKAAAAMIASSAALSEMASGVASGADRPKVRR